MPRLSNKLNKPLIEILIISLVLHAIGLFVLGGISLFKHINASNPDFEAPVVAEPQEIQVPIPVKLALKQTEAPKDMMKLEVKTISVESIEVALPVVSQRVSIGAYGKGTGNRFGDGLGGAGLDLSSMAFGGIMDSGESVCFIVDYSKSMDKIVPGSKFTRFALLKEQLRASIKGMSSQMLVSMIFFSGPAWVAGQSESQVRSKYSSTDGNWHSHRPKNFDSLVKPGWQLLMPEYRDQLITYVNKEPMSGGTVWSNPLRLARPLEPAPEVIYFLTDGATDEKDTEETLALVREMKKESPKLRINTIAFGEPKAANALRRMASMTGGKFRLIESMSDIEDSEKRNDG